MPMQSPLCWIAQEKHTNLYLGTEYHNPLKNLSKGGEQIVVFFDDKLSKTFLEPIIDLLKPELIISINASEENKSREEKDRIEDLLLRASIHKESVFVAIGGGVVCDLVGFIAASYMRGVALVFIPTTLLCMVDACLGGKTGLNALGIKNCLGLYYPADHILIDPTWLSTLPRDEKISGMAEVIKYGLICDGHLCRYLLENPKRFFDGDPAFFEKIISDSIGIKRRITEEDPYEQGIRRLLNFGHTIGHALESLMKYTLSHGEAVAYGMCVEALMSFHRGYLPQEDLYLSLELIQAYGFSLQNIGKVKSQDLLPYLAMDKKRGSGSMKCSFLKKMGQALSFEGRYVFEFSLEQLDIALQSLRRHLGMSL